MPISKLENVVSSLSKFFGLPDETKLLESSLTQEERTETPEIHIARLILKGTDGNLTTKEIINDINAYLSKSETNSEDAKNVNRYLKIFTTIDDSLVSQEPIPSNISDIGGKIESKNKETKEHPNLSIICANHSRINISNKETNALTLFFNAIPTLEFSRCLPYLRVEVIVSRPPLNEEGRINSLSSLRFLLGAEKLEPGTATEKIMQASSIGNDSSFAGMELFTSPQMLINRDIVDDVSLRVAPVLDKFRPFLSIDRLNIGVHPADGALSVKKGELHLTLHDRSRLAEISELVKPDLYGKTELLLEYGWSHPDRTGTNIFADLLNSMRVKEKYKVYNSQIEFDDLGQAKIKLDIAMTGATDFFNTDITESDSSVANATKNLQRLIEEIENIKDALFKNNNQFMKRLRPLVVLETPSDLATVPDMKTVMKELRKVKNEIKRKGSPKSLRELLDKLEELYGFDKGKSSKRGIGTLKRSVADAFREKMDRIANVKEERTLKGKIPLTKTEATFQDPFLDLNKSQEDLNFLSGKYVSLGKLFLVFVAYPLLSTGKFDDIQFVFYMFNRYAGNLANKNIAEFKIDTKDFYRKMMKLWEERKSANIPLWEFKEFILNQYVDDFGNSEYGIGDHFLNEIDKETGKKKFIKKYEKDGAVYYDREQAIEGLALPKDGTFKLPMIDIHVETTPGTSLIDGEDPDAKNEKTILKVHIFDRQNSSYDTQQALLRASRTDAIETINLNINRAKDENRGKDEFQKYLNIAQEMGLIEPFDQKNVEKGERNVVQIKGGPRELKRFLYETTPYIIYGNQNTALTKLGAKTLYHSELTTINLNRSARDGNLVPAGTEQNNFPLVMMPGEMNATSLGCPILSFMQQFFVDLGTNTDLDNIYGIGELSHTIEPGKFETNFRMIPNDGYGAYRSLIHNLGVAVHQISGKEET